MDDRYRIIYLTSSAIPTLELSQPPAFTALNLSCCKHWDHPIPRHKLEATFFRVPRVFSPPPPAPTHR